MSDSYVNSARQRFKALPLAEQWREANRFGSPTLEEHIRRHYNGIDIDRLRQRLGIPYNEPEIRATLNDATDLNALKKPR